ncbi:ABC transporter, ATP-binding protein [Methylophaga thiooxydans DMS010]|uniref:ABC transporter, ATP-binding protein n=1 Tax=Methylophaga thiooxydans DMS010 TaxID=637616 RepID=C0N743_9GAMM|nr:ABC transporter ATP-binding protein [Methylophaga thiooxydans]EEF79381.1 ABC transporter, ATP-binding protein [Methylophaga thiooxydans DMS010]
MMKEPLLQASELSRYFGTEVAVNNVSFTIHKGEVLGFLGPNGAGKSTTMRMLSGNLAPDNGQIIINGVDLLDHPKQAKAHIGYLPETPPLYKELTVAEFLQFCARLNAIDKQHQKAAIDSAIERCGLTNVSNRLIGNLSKGFQQRVGIAQAIIHSPAVVILDEPTSGLDPIQIREIRQLIRDIANEHSVILSTHILPEVQMLCDRVQIISHGQLMFNDSIDALSQKMQASSLLLAFEQPMLAEKMRHIPGIENIDTLSDYRFRVHYHPDTNPTQSLLQLAVNNAWQLSMLMPEQHSLEDVFMKIIQNEDTDA